jgi:hypothetical protein
MHGHLRQSEKIVYQVLQYALTQRGKLPEPASIALITLSHIYRLRNELAEAFQLVQRATAVDPNPTSSNMPVNIAIATRQTASDLRQSRRSQGHHSGSAGFTGAAPFRRLARPGFGGIMKPCSVSARKIGLRWSGCWAKPKKEGTGWRSWCALMCFCGISSRRRPKRFWSAC